jgi:formylglycine-generating enzyme required for sulfatase activity
MKIILRDSFSLSLSALPISAKRLKMLGSPEDEPGREGGEERQFKATISQGFWLSQYLVTQAQWQVVIKGNPSHFVGHIDCPIENVSWHQAISFCQELNRSFFDTLPEGYKFCLPTEAEWEYACRAGTQTIYHSGDSLVDLSRVAWHEGNSLGRTHPVGEKEPNAWGLFDMHGNVFEWCYDSPSDYPDSHAVDWMGSGDGFVRSLRSASWKTPPGSTAFRCACRNWAEPNTRRSWFGFRISLRKVDLCAR